MTHRYVDEWDETHACTACGREIGLEQSSNGCGCCELCFDALAPDEQDRLRDQDRLLIRTLRRLYPCGIGQAEG